MACIASLKAIGRGWRTRPLRVTSAGYFSTAGFMFWMAPIVAALKDRPATTALGRSPHRMWRRPPGLPEKRKEATTVVRITVEPGQRVSKGEVLIVLEAMKMELPIKAPRDGSVKAIACRPGELVQPGVPLLELE
jgi:multidrug efflux pump subunit AcrA (membrane-fusion protein)